MSTLSASHAVSPAGAVRLRVLTSQDVPAASRLLAGSFEEDPASVAFVRDPAVRLKLNELSSARTLRAALPHASVYGAEVDGSLAGVAVWHPPGARTGDVPASMRYARDLVRELPDLPPVIARIATTAVTDLAAARRFATQHAEAVRRAADGPAWHLAVLATDGAYRGRGLGRRLIDHVLDRCDRDGLAAWLETTNPVNPPIYERFGFETVAEIEGGRIIPTWWVMRRPAPHPM